eukprot:sb/3475139/
MAAGDEGRVLLKFSICFTSCTAGVEPPPCVDDFVGVSVALPRKEGSKSFGSHDLLTVTPLLTTVASGSMTVVGANKDFLNTETPRRPRPRTRATTNEEMRGHPRRARKAPTHRMKRTVDVCFCANDIPP